MDIQLGGDAKVSLASRESCKMRVPDLVICKLRAIRAEKIRG